MQHKASKKDREYLNSFKSLEIDVSGFHHREHILITYTLLIDMGVKETFESVKNGILALLKHLGVSTNKYHETMSYAWVLIVNHFMNITQKECTSFDEFIENNKILLDRNILYNHYSKTLLNSDVAKIEYVFEDLQKIPIY